jgi:hypothetical protein
LTTPADISVTLPVSVAINRVKLLLFEPFDLGKWFTIGFCAWLAHLGETGFQANYKVGAPPRNGGVSSVHEVYEHARAYVLDNLGWILPLAVALVFISFAFWVLLTWLRSRGKFMFLHCVALNKAEINVPWYKFAREGNSLFQFRLVLGLIGMIPMLPLLVLAALMVIRMLTHGAPEFHGILVLIGIMLMLLSVGMVFFVIGKLTTDFVVPIMFLRGATCLGAWRELLGLIAGQVPAFLLYLLFQMVLGLATGVIVLIAIIGTCCIAGCLMVIPYLGTVLLLPISVFKQSYSLYYLAQYGQHYDVFPPSLPPQLGVTPPLP